MTDQEQNAISDVYRGIETQLSMYRSKFIASIDQALWHTRETTWKKAAKMLRDRAENYRRSDNCELLATVCDAMANEILADKPWEYD